MEISVILPHIEALIFASEKPLTSLELTELTNNALGFLDDKISLDQVEAAVTGVIEKYSSDFYPFEIRESGGGWQFLTKKDYHKTVAQLNGEKFLKRLSAASLETLAIIAYKQPITKGEIESIRGVNSDYSIQKLLEKELIIITGRNEELPGKPLLYTTSKTFMDYFGINSPDELPAIKEVLAAQPLSPTPVPAHISEGLFRDNPVDEPIEETASDVLPDSDGELVIRGNGEIIEEPEVVVEKVTEVIEPEQVISTDSVEEGLLEEETVSQDQSDSEDNNIADVDQSFSEESVSSNDEIGEQDDQPNTHEDVPQNEDISQSIPHAENSQAGEEDSPSDVSRNEDQAT